MDNNSDQRTEVQDVCQSDERIPCTAKADIDWLKREYTRLSEDVDALGSKLNRVKSHLDQQISHNTSTDQRFESIVAQIQRLQIVLSEELHKLSALIVQGAASSAVQHQHDVEISSAWAADWNRRQIKWVALISGGAATGAAAIVTAIAALIAKTGW